MTTIVAVRGNGFVIMCSDLQATSELSKEVVNKIRPIRPHELLGCSGSAEYIEIFYRYVVKQIVEDERPDYTWALNKAIDSYCKYVSNRIDELRLDRVPYQSLSDYYPSAIFSCYDQNQKKLRVFQIRTPDPCYEISDYQSIAAVGSGGPAATVILKTLENLMLSWKVLGNLQIDWSRFSWQTIARLCHILLRRISELDSNTSGFDFHRLNEEGETGISRSEYFPRGEVGLQLSQLIEGAAKDIGEEGVLHILDETKLGDFMKSFLGLG